MRSSRDPKSVENQTSIVLPQFPALGATSHELCFPAVAATNPAPASLPRPRVYLVPPECGPDCNVLPPPTANRTRSIPRGQANPTPHRTCPRRTSTIPPNTWHPASPPCESAALLQPLRR